MPVPGAARDALERFLEKRAEVEGGPASGGPLFPLSGPLALPSASTIGRMLARAGEQAGLSARLGVRSLRRAMITQLIAAGASLNEIALLARRARTGELGRHRPDGPDETPKAPRP